MRFFRVFLALATLCTGIASASSAPQYYWRMLPGGEPVTGQLLTLFCQTCGTGNETGQDIPLVSVLRDTLGQRSPADHRVTAVWLLTYSNPTVGQRTLAAVPFFYWTLSDGSADVKRKDTKPLLDLSAPQHPAVYNVERQILQWTALDTIGTPLRATSRAYRTNETDHERLHLEEANSYLANAPVGDNPTELTAEERDYVMARLELRKNLLGGFVSASRAASMGREQGFEDERVRLRNWELLRQLAEKAGLVFQPIALAGSDESYAMLWYPSRAQMEPDENDLGEIWKLLSIKDPYSDDRLTHWNGVTKTVGNQTLIPLGFYSLTYPRQPLLLVDFRDKLHPRRRDVTQKSIDEITSGVMGLSHFTNWYYYAGSDIYNFIEGRMGKANNRSERLDSYGQFRMALALDHDMEPALHAELERRSDALFTDPLVSSPAKEMQAALNRYTWLSVEAAGDNSRLMQRIDNQRREELAAYGLSPRRQATDIALHVVTLGKYTHRAKRDSDNLALLSMYRRTDYDLQFLDKLVAAGTPPEVTHSDADLRNSVSELSSLLPAIDNQGIRQHAELTLQSLSKISADTELRADCQFAIARLKDNQDSSPRGVPGVLASPSLEKLK